VPGVEDHDGRGRASAAASPASVLAEESVIRAILEGTAGETGEEFFAALVKNLCHALDVAGAWVTEYLQAAGRLRALAFWFQDRFVPDYEYSIPGTPCEPVIATARLIHFPDNIVRLFPGDPDLASFRAVSYMGVPLPAPDGTILGHLAVLDTKPMPMDGRLVALFRIFAARAAAELQRLRAEADVREREAKLSRLVASAMDAIFELDARLRVTGVNPSGAAVFGSEPERMAGRDLREFLADESGAKLMRLVRELEARREGRQYLWVPGGLSGRRADGEAFPAEATLSRFEVRGTSCFTLILRNVHDQLEAERKIESLASESAYLKDELAELHNFRELVGQSRAMRELFRSIRQVARTDTTVLVYGETGTGKELVARAIHAGSPRAARPLVKVNCAAVPHALMESEFFGHEKGAFTGATQRRDGRFALAHQGTIFLDEIGELPLDLQAKLLRVLQEGEFEAVGTSQTRKVDVRVIAATNRDLPQAVREGRFREDLYYRLNVFPIVVPPLRERGTDVELLAAIFAKRFAQKVGRETRPLTRECIRRLRTYSWPGNVRELQNLLERAVILSSRDGTLDLTPLLPPPAEMAPPAPAGAAPGAGDVEEIQTTRDLRARERDNLVRALERSGWRVAGPNGAARRLGMPASTLASRMKALGIRRPGR
jgi:PAS domain S-box-containing protein